MADNINFAVRTLELSDIPNIVSYWLESSPTDLARMGADATKFPTAEQLEISPLCQLSCPVGDFA
ncbi:MAG: hypothetical protein KBT66_16270 [Amphritea sp.]|nr:hypothetical protein [Amphritea sp.]